MTPIDSTALSAALASDVARNLSPLERQRCEAEHRALDLIHAALRQYPAGLPKRRLADLTGLAVGYVGQVLRSSECVLRRRKLRPRCWWADWTDLDAGFRPRGRPRKDGIELAPLPGRRQGPAKRTWAWEV